MVASKSFERSETVQILQEIGDMAPVNTGTSQLVTLADLEEVQRPSSESDEQRQGN